MVYSEIFWTVVAATVVAQIALFCLGLGIAQAVKSIKKSRAHRETLEAMNRCGSAAGEFPISGGVPPEFPISGGKPPSRACPYCATVMVECAHPTIDDIRRAPADFYSIRPGRCPSCQSLQSGMASVSPVPWFRKGFLAGNFQPPACECPSCETGAPKTPPPEGKDAHP